MEWFVVIGGLLILGIVAGSFFYTKNEMEKRNQENQNDS